MTRLLCDCFSDAALHSCVDLVQNNDVCFGPFPMFEAFSPTAPVRPKSMFRPFLLRTEIGLYKGNGVANAGAILWGLKVSYSPTIKSLAIFYWTLRWKITSDGDSVCNFAGKECPHCSFGGAAIPRPVPIGPPETATCPWR